MIESVAVYLEELKVELSGCDPAIIHDALADAEEHLRNALDQVYEPGKGVSEAEALVAIIEKYGSPEEIAVAYREIETRTQPALAELAPMAEKSFISRYFSVISDARAWGALLYLVLSISTGIVYFTFAVTGLSLSLGLMVLIIGLPFMVLFLLSVRSMAFVEGRIVEALLGVRMPRRPLFTNRQAGWMEQVKSIFREMRTWSALAYMVLQLPLGIVYFTVFCTLIALSLGFMLNPILVYVLDIPVIHFGGVGYRPSIEFMLIVVIAGLILLITTMHLARFVGRQHGAIAKSLLVGGGRESEESRTVSGDRKTRFVEEPVETKKEIKHETEERLPLPVVILTSVVLVAVIGIVLLAFLLQS